MATLVSSLDPALKRIMADDAQAWEDEEDFPIFMDDEEQAAAREAADAAHRAAIDQWLAEQAVDQMFPEQPDDAAAVFTAHMLVEMSGWQRAEAAQ